MTIGLIPRTEETSCATQSPREQHSHTNPKRQQGRDRRVAKQSFDTRRFQAELGNEGQCREANHAPGDLRPRLAR